MIKIGMGSEPLLRSPDQRHPGRNDDHRLVLPRSRRLPGKDRKGGTTARCSKNTEIFLISEGHLIEIIEGKLYPVKEGDGSILPSNIGHGALIREVDFKAIDIFVPPREDYLEKRCKTLKSTPDGVRFF